MLTAIYNAWGNMEKGFPFPIVRSIPKDTPNQRRTIAKNPEDILMSLRGQTIIVPNLYEIHEGWTYRTSPHGEEVKRQADTWIKTWVHGDRQKRYLASRFDELAVLVYPDCSADKCVLGCKYLMWLFYWDDEFDCGSFTTDLDGGKNFVKRTKDFFQAIYEGTESEINDEKFPPAIESFLEVGRVILRGGARDPETRQLEENLSYINNIIPTLQRREKDLFVDVERYLLNRLPNSAMIPSYYIIENLLHLKIPNWVLDLEETKVLIVETAMMVQIANDIVSLAKEVREGQVDNIVPILMQNYNIDPQSAVNRAVELLRRSFRKFCAAEAGLKARMADSLVSSGEKEDVDRFILAGKDWVIGGLHWGFLTPRYMQGSSQLSGGRIAFHL